MATVDTGKHTYELVDSHGDIYINQNQEGRRLLKYCR